MTKLEIKNGVLHTDEFMIFDSSGSPVTGLIDGNFTKYLYNPAGSEVSGSVTVTVSELGNGSYRVTFTPNALGSWILIVINVANVATKLGNYECRTNTIDDVDTVVDAIQAVTDLLPDAGALTSILTHLTDIKGAGWVDENLTTIDAVVDAILAFGAPPSVGDIADQVWDEPAADHVASGSFGEIAAAWYEGNISYEFVKQTVTPNLTRNVAVGVLSHYIIKVKADADSDWSSPISTKTLYMWYETINDTNPQYVKESD